MRAPVRALTATLTIAGLGVLPASAAAATGGSAAPGEPRITLIRCVPSPAAACPAPDVLAPGGEVRVRGRELATARTVVFQGRRGASDDVAVRARHVGGTHFEAAVPRRARSGRLEVRTTHGARAVAPRVRIARLARPAAGDDAYFADGRRRPSFTFQPVSPGAAAVELVDGAGVAVRTWAIEAGSEPVTVRWDGQIDGQQAPNGSYSFRTASAHASAASSPAFAFYDHRFPIRGRHNLGQTETNNFGGGRGHEGQDMFADCGTRIAAARGGRVRYAGYQGNAGNYVVITSKDTGLDYVYMHMQSKPLVSTDDRVRTGQPLGAVGDTGRAYGCHLHFELWSSPGWYSGGEPFDPLPRLRQWDAWS